MGDDTGDAYTVGDATPGIITVDVDYDVELSISSGAADVLETVELDLDMSNTGPVGGFQFDLIDTPDDVDIVSVATTDRTAGFSVDYNALDEGVRIIALATDNNYIDPGEGAVLIISYQVHEDAYAGDIEINFSNISRYVFHETRRNRCAIARFIIKSPDLPPQRPLCYNYLPNCKINS